MAQDAVEAMAVARKELEEAKKASEVWHAEAQKNEARLAQELVLLAQLVVLAREEDDAALELLDAQLLAAARLLRGLAVELEPLAPLRLVVVVVRAARAALRARELAAAVLAVLCAGSRGFARGARRGARRARERNNAPFCASTKST